LQHYRLHTVLFYAVDVNTSRTSEEGAHSPSLPKRLIIVIVIIVIIVIIIIIIIILFCVWEIFTVTTRTP
jgi:heme/copper-type cytochrome/quinol oxidase subunit 2